MSPPSWGPTTSPAPKASVATPKAAPNVSAETWSLTRAAMIVGTAVNDVPRKKAATTAQGRAPVGTTTAVTAMITKAARVVVERPSRSDRGPNAGPPHTVPTPNAVKANAAADDDHPASSSSVATMNVMNDDMPSANNP